MAYVKAAGDALVQYPYTIGQLRKDNSNVSFPRSISAQTLADYGVYEVTTAERPSYDARTQTAEMSAAPTKVGSAWTLGWVVSSKTAEQIQQYDDNAAAGVRAQRDRLLADCDWVVIMNTEKGTNIPLEWELYRQNLRDITDQAGFPHNVTWPTKP